MLKNSRFKVSNIFIFVFLLAMTSCQTSSDSSSSSSSDSVAPKVSSIYPSEGATSVAINTSISVTFDEAMDETSVTINTSDTSCSGSLQVSDDDFTSCVQMSAAPSADNEKKTFTVNPASDMSVNTLHKVKITTAVKDSAGNALESEYVTATGFTTGSVSDSTAPTVSSVSPEDGATSIAINATVSATFSEALDSTTVTSSTFTLSQGSNSVSGTVNYGSNAATFTPAANLSGNQQHTATLTTGVKDAAGNALESNHSWSFTTGAQSAGIYDTAVYGTGIYSN